MVPKSLRHLPFCLCLSLLEWMPWNMQLSHSRTLEVFCQQWYHAICRSDRNWSIDKLYEILRFDLPEEIAVIATCINARVHDSINKSWSSGSSNNTSKEPTVSQITLSNIFDIDTTSTRHKWQVDFFLFWSHIIAVTLVSFRRTSGLLPVISLPMFFHVKKEVAIPTKWIWSLFEIDGSGSMRIVFTSADDIKICIDPTIDIIWNAPFYVTWSWSLNNKVVWYWMVKIYFC